MRGGWSAGLLAGPLRPGTREVLRCYDVGRELPLRASIVAIAASFKHAPRA